MAKLSVVKYPADQSVRWDAFMARSSEGTIFHQLNFLAYHRERFRQREHHLIWYHGQQPYALYANGDF